MPSPYRSHWSLDPEVTFLNHGSFGACPIPVLDAQARIRADLEREPVHFFVRRYFDLLDASRFALAAFVNADPDGLAFVDNATTGVNAVLRSLEFAPGDELLVTDHEYNACRNVLDYVARRSGARVVVATVPFPLNSSAQVVEAILAQVTPRTRIALVDHVTSATGLVLPLATIVSELQRRGVDVLVDGAHAPGMIELDLASLAPAYYTGNCHKWLCAPKGAGMLYVREDRRDAIRPAVISHGANMPTDQRSRFRHEFDWVGTHDPSPWICVKDSIEFLTSLFDGDYAALRRRNRDLALEARDVLCRALGLAKPAPDDMIGTLAAVPLSDGEAAKPSALYVDPLQQQLWDAHRIEVPISPWPHPPKRLLRVSAQLYNSIEDYQKLAAALVEAGARGGGSSGAMA